MRKNFFILIVLLPLFCLGDGSLFVGLEGSAPSTYVSDMEGFPSIGWNAHFSHDVSGAAATPDGRIYICEGAFTTHLYQATLETTPSQLCTIAEDMSALAYGRDTLWGYSNYASPRGIYSIDVNTGATELALDVGSYRFFALDYNPQDDLFYGYTEYGSSGLYSINIDSGQMLQLAGSIPASNGQGRGMAVGDNTAFLTATRGDDGIGYFSYDISQGAGGEWVEFTNPYPNHHSTGGAAWIAQPEIHSSVYGLVVCHDEMTGLANCLVELQGETNYQTTTDQNGLFMFEEVLNNASYGLGIQCDGYMNYSQNVNVGINNLDLGEIVMNEYPYPPQQVIALETTQYEEVTLSWQPPGDRLVDSYLIYRFLESQINFEPQWTMLADNYQLTEYLDDQWQELPEETYMYAVKALYNTGLTSVAALSNSLQKIVTEGDETEISTTPGCLRSIYPNPFNPETVISYELKSSEHVLIEAYNARGEKAGTLVDARLEAGEYKYIWKAQAFRSGLYFIRLTAGDNIEIRKAVLLK